MTRSFTELNDAITQWAIDRDLIQQNPTHQLAKMLEEYHELVEAHQQDDEPEIRDAIGDIQVTILVYCAQRGIPPMVALQAWYNADYFGQVWDEVSSTFSGDAVVWQGALSWSQVYQHHVESSRARVARYVGWYYRWLLEYCATHDYNPLDCLDDAYEVIRDRSGLIVGGQFKKASDLEGAG